MSLIAEPALSIGDIADNWSPDMRLAEARTEAGVDRRSHDSGQDLQARQQISADTVRAGRTRCPRAAAKDGKVVLVACDTAKTLANDICAASSMYSRSTD
jgi:hypothetical protein